MIKFAFYPNKTLELGRAEAAFSEVAGCEMTGWLRLPTPETNLEEIKAVAQEIRKKAEILVCVGIGGSYLGHKAVIEALGNRSGMKILYAGNSLSAKALAEVLNEISDKDFAVNVISKSGTTMEPAIAFRILKRELIERYGPEEADRRIYVTTDRARGALFEEATKNGYRKFIAPDNVGGRYSVLTSVGLLPLAVAGLEIDELIAGAMEEAEAPEVAFRYAALRAKLVQEGFDTEVFASFEPEMREFGEWWKQLFGESEGKNHQGIFPASVTYTTDLHSLGQFLQDGRRNLFETVVKFTTVSEHGIVVPEMEDDSDGLNYLAGKTLSGINEKACEATVWAHREGGIPVAQVVVPELSEKSLGALIYFFEVACATSATMQGVNPFDQPGVEAYKKNMFRLLGKPEA